MSNQTVEIAVTRRLLGQVLRMRCGDWYLPLQFVIAGVSRNINYVKIGSLPARVAELADAPDLGSGSERSAGSIPVPSNWLAFIVFGDCTGCTAAVSLRPLAEIWPSIRRY